MARIGVLEDDVTQATLLQAELEQAGHDIVLFATAHDFRRGLARAGLDLVVLDWMLPDESGVEVLDWLRASAYASMPVLMLTMRDQESDVLTAFQAGADDFLAKPASVPILVARIAAQLRRSGVVDTGAILRLPPYVIDQKRRSVSVGEDTIDLTEKEFDLACCLFRRANLMVGRDLILREVWQVHGGVETRSLDTYISRLRKRLGLDGSHGWRLRTIYQHGYRLEAETEACA
jgi:two-component system, OmpR family, response regulator RegX3